MPPANRTQSVLQEQGPRRPGKFVLASFSIAIILSASSGPARASSRCEEPFRFIARQSIDQSSIHAPKGLFTLAIATESPIRLKIAESAQNHRSPSIENELKALLAEIRSAEDFTGFLQFIRKLAQIEYDTPARNFSPARHKYFADDLLHSLGKTDIVAALLKIKNQASPEQLDRWLLDLDMLPEQVPTDHDRERHDRLNWFHLCLTIQMALDPHLSQNYLQRLKSTPHSDSFARSLAEDMPQYSRYLFTPNTISALHALPDDYHRKLKQRLLETMETEPKDSRRNLEALLRVLNQQHVKALKETLRANPVLTESETIARLSEHWSSLGPPSRYQPGLVLEVARTLQQSSAAKYLARGGEFLMMGSFPNGKFKPESSDIDVIVKGEASDLLQNLKYAMGGKETPEIRALFRAAEKQLAELVGRKTYAVDHFLSLNSNALNPSSYMQYNPIQIRVTADKVYLRLYDFFDGNETVESEIIPSVAR